MQVFCAKFQLFVLILTTTCILIKTKARIALVIAYAIIKPPGNVQKPTMRTKINLRSLFASPLQTQTAR